ncbi:MAG: hypothetical protein JOZ53_25305 [Planctomycetaceae bacterium]|nr:hypothetical protein [Planctomycetaceae bacterium]
MATRREGTEDSDLGACDAVALHQALREWGHPDVPAIWTPGRLLLRRGARDAGRRVRRPAPPRRG